MNLYILQLHMYCRIDANHRKGRIGKWQQRKQPRRHPRKRRPQRRPQRRSSGPSNQRQQYQKAILRGTHSASPSVFSQKEYTLKQRKRTLTAMTRRRWIAEHWDEATATITGAQAEHMARVLRAQPGIEADVVAGGHVFHAEVAAVTRDEIRFNLIAELQADPALPVTLVIAVYKFDRMEWAIEKATELGVAAVAPVIARRTEKHLALASEARAERWRRIVLEAAQQSRRSDVPLIHEPAPLSKWVRAESGV